MAQSPAPERVLGVAALSRLIKESLEGEFPAVWVRGEIAGCRRAETGHFYFSLKEGRDAQLDCVLWRTTAMRVGLEPKDGVQVEAFGGISVYEPRGRYQLVVRDLRLAGLGALLLALEELKKKLQAEGLFDPARKRPLPRYPRRIGLVTSPAGAAVRDMVKVLRARWPGIGIVLAPVRVQGPGAAFSIAHGIEQLRAFGGVDLLIVGRGGGSLEDLWAFNEEQVVRAIVRSRVPVISAVGHEVDWTLADMAADVRAATPSNAAETAVPDAREVARAVAELRRRARRSVAHGLDERRRRVQRATEKYGFRRQRDSLAPARQRIDELVDRMRGALRAGVTRLRERWREATGRYGLREWPRTLVERRARLVSLGERFDETVVRSLAGRRSRLESLEHRLRALSPRHVLERGFCIARRADGSVATSSEALAIGESIAVEFAQGGADARVERIRLPVPHGTS
jgi:exodeoxyribonuclease VII large subunit